MQFHKVTMLIGDEDVHGDPAEWDWEALDIAPFVYIVESQPITRNETPFDQALIKEWEAEERFQKEWENRPTQRGPKP